MQGGLFGNALHSASNGGHHEVVKVLLEHGANMNMQGGLFGNALHSASEGGHLEVVEVRRKHGANVNTQVELADAYPLSMGAISR